MKKNINITLLTAIIIVVSMLQFSCDNGLNGVGYNDDPDNVGFAPAPNVLGLSELATGVLNGSDNSRYASINVGYISGLTQQFAPINNYVYSPQAFDGLWSTIYVDGIKPAKLAEDSGNSTSDMEMVASAKVLRALFLVEAAANWGDVPNSEVLVDGIIAPAYDSQMSVFQNAIELLDDAILAAPNSTKYFNDGIGGTVTSSTISQLANSLKARTYLIMKDYTNALLAAQNGIQNSDGDLIVEHSSTIGAKNLYYQFIVEQRGGYIGPDNSFLEKMLNSADASVSRSLVTPGDSNRYSYYYTSPTAFNTTSGIFADSAPTKIVTYYETKLIEAECYYRLTQEANALSSLNEVRDALAVEFGGSFPHSTATGNDVLTHVLEEKYISLFPSSQTFHDATRTNNMLGITPNAGTSLPERFLYPQDEINANSNLVSPIPGTFEPTPINQ